MRAAPVSLAMFDREMNYLATSARWVREYGRGRESVVGLNHDTVLPDLPEPWREAYRRALGGESVESDDELWREADGTRRWLRRAALPWRTADGAVGGIIVWAEDRTDHRRIEEELRRATAETRRVMDTAAVGLVRNGRDLRYREVNAAYARWIGIPAEQIVGRPIADVMGPAAFETIRPRVERVLAGERVEYEDALTINGRRRPIHVVYEPDRDAAGEVIGWIASVTDLSELYLSSERLLDLDAMDRLLRLSARLVRDDEWSGVMEEILAVAIAISEADFGVVQTLDPRSGDLRIAFHRGLPDRWVEHWNRVSKGRGACGTALERRERVIVEDVATCPIFDEAARAVHLDADVRAMQSTPLLSRSGEPLGVISTLHRSPRQPTERARRFLDLLARQAADFLDRSVRETALRRSQQTFAGILMTSADGIVSVDGEQRITRFNQGAEEIFGYSAAEVIGAPLDKLIPPRLRADHQRYVDAFAAGPMGARVLDRRSPDAVGLRKDGEEFRADVSISKFEVDGQVVLTATIRNATEERLLAAMGAALNPLAMEGTFSDVATALAQHMGDFCVVYGVDESGGLRPVAAACRDPADAALADRVMALGAPPPEHPASRCFMERRAVIVDLGAKDYPSYAEGPERLRVLRDSGALHGLVVPLLQGEECLGVVGVSSRSRAYNERDLRLVEEIARRTVLFMENARLHGAEQRAIRTRDEVLGVVAHDLRNPLGLFS